MNPDFIRPISRFGYKPEGNTPLNDAIGDMLDYLEEYDFNAPHSDSAFLIIIISDGQENASRKYTQNDIASRISRLKETGRWTFAYVGANQDVYEVAKSYGFQPYQWAHTTAGTSRTYNALSSSVINYMDLRDSGLQTSTSFFSPDNVTLTITNDGEGS